jgi:nucleoside permease NupC
MIREIAIFLIGVILLIIISVVISNSKREIEVSDDIRSADNDNVKEV